MKILVTGGHGFLGQAVVRQLKHKGICFSFGEVLPSVCAPMHAQLDLLNKDEVDSFFRFTAPDAVVHLAARVGGVFSNQESPGTFFAENMRMGLNIVEAARVNGVRRFITVGTACSYPADALSPIRESRLGEGKPAESTAPYGIAKLALLTMLQAYEKQYGFPFVYLIPTNLYGPGDESDHVIADICSTMKAYSRRNVPVIKLRGQAKARRDFLYVDDCADAIVRALAMKTAEAGEVLNLGTGHALTIERIAQKIQVLMGLQNVPIQFEGKIGGAISRCLDPSRAKKILDWEPTTSLSTGLQNTVDWMCKTL